MSARRKFDHDEARRLRDSGLSYAKIGTKLGVSEAAAYYACCPALEQLDANWCDGGTAWQSLYPWNQPRLVEHPSESSE